VGTLHHTGLASFHSANDTALQKGVKSFLWTEPGHCMATESGDRQRTERANGLRLLMRETTEDLASA
jgi:phage-related protein